MPTSDYDRVASAIDYLDRHRTDQPTLEDVARFGLPSTDLTQLRICCADQLSSRERQLLSMIEPWTDAPVSHTELL